MCMCVCVCIYISVYICIYRLPERLRAALWTAHKERHACGGGLYIYIYIYHVSCVYICMYKDR